MLLTTNDSAHYGNHQWDRHHHTDHHGQRRPRSDDVFQGQNDYPRNSDRRQDSRHVRGPHDRNRRNHRNGPPDAPNLDEEGAAEGARDHENDRPLRNFVTFVFAMTNCSFVFRSSTATSHLFAATNPIRATIWSIKSRTRHLLTRTASDARVRTRSHIVYEPTLERTAFNSRSRTLHGGDERRDLAAATHLRPQRVIQF